MNPVRFLLFLPVACLCLSATLVAGEPGLLFGPEEITGVRTNVAAGGIAGAAYGVMMKDAEAFLALKTDPYGLAGAVTGRALGKQVLTLAMASHISGDRRYADHGIAVLCAAAAQTDVGTFAKLNGALAVGDAAHAYVVGSDWLAPWLDEPQREALHAEIREYGEWLFAHSQTDFWGHSETRRMAHNWNGVTHGALGLTALALGDESAWLARATERVRDYFRESHDATGAGYEGVTYLAYGLQNTVPFAIALRRSGGPDLLAESPPLRQIPDYVLWQTLPTGRSIMPINQCGTALQPAGGVFYLINHFQDRVGLWGWLRLFGDEGDGTYGASTWLGNGASLPYVVLWSDPALQPQSPPDAGCPLSRFFARGQMSARDGWGGNDTLVTFTSGKGIPGVWNQGDENSFTFSSRGERFAVDPGSSWGKTAEHNAILIDGVGEAAEGGPQAVQGRIVASEDRGDVLTVTGDATAAYRSKQPIDHALRHLTFLRGLHPVLIVADDIRKDDQPHDYAWLLYSAKGNRIEVLPDRRSARIVGAERGAACWVGFLAPDQELVFETDIARKTLPRLTVRTTAVEPGFVAVLVALAPGEPDPAVIRQADGVAAELRFADGSRLALPLGAADRR